MPAFRVGAAYVICAAVVLCVSLFVMFMSASPVRAGAADPSNQPLHLQVEGTYHTGVFASGAAEIPAYNSRHKLLYVANSHANTIDIINVRDPGKPALVSQVSVARYGAGVNSVAYKNGVLVAALEASPKQDPGWVVFLSPRGKFLNRLQVGALPDMVTITPDGNTVLVANEGEPDDNYQHDPPGSVSLIRLGRTRPSRLTAADVHTIPLDIAVHPAVRIYGPNASVGQDLEPEYITVAPDSSTAWVSLQENNALAVIDIKTASLVRILPLGSKAAGPNNPIDAARADGGINLRTWPVDLLYQPDAIGAYQAGDETYVVTANEGDVRDYAAYSETATVAQAGQRFRLDPGQYPPALIQQLRQPDALGELQITTASGDHDGDGDIDRMHVPGGRSFSIWKGNGELIYDSGADFAHIIARDFPRYFYSDGLDNNSFEAGSTLRGAEPEGLALGKVKGRHYAFISLERMGGVIVYDITRPQAPEFIEYVNNRNFSGQPSEGTAGDLGPEGLLFIPRKQAPGGKYPHLVVTNESSGTTTLYSVRSPDSRPYEKDSSSD